MADDGKEREAREGLAAILRFVLDELRAMRADHVATRAALEAANAARAEASKRAEADARAILRAIGELRTAAATLASAADAAAVGAKIDALAARVGALSDVRAAVEAADDAAADALARDRERVEAHRLALIDRLGLAASAVWTSRPGAIAAFAAALAIARWLGVEAWLARLVVPAGGLDGGSP